MTQTPEEAKALEAQLCVICNGTGIKDGENPMCIEHYKSEVIDKGLHPKKQAPMVNLPNAYLRVNYDKPSGMFILTWLEASEEGSETEQKIFELTLLPETFQKLTADMVKIVKDFNLMQAKEFEEKENERRANGDSTAELENGDAESVGVEGASEESKEDNTRANDETQGVVPEV